MYLREGNLSLRQRDYLSPSDTIIGQIELVLHRVHFFFLFFATLGHRWCSYSARLSWKWETRRRRESTFQERRTTFERTPGVRLKKRGIPTWDYSRRTETAARSRLSVRRCLSSFLVNLREQRLTLWTHYDLIEADVMYTHTHIRARANTQALAV